MRTVGTLLTTMVLGLSCTRAGGTLTESCQTSADCGQGLVCLGSQCGACRQDSECPSPARCGLIQAGRCGCFDADGDGASCDDCDDADPARFPAAAEVCDGKDNDCDGTIDEGAVTSWFVDADGDGYGNSGLSLERCQAPANFVARGGDCNDSDPTTYPGRSEVCDARDNDCNGTIDEGVKTTFYRDADGDGFGDARNVATTCQIPAAGFVSVAGDCDDSRAEANPQAVETCNNRDDDCDGVVDGVTRACSNACGEGMETCTRGVWAGCTAPPIITISSPTTVSGPRATYDCLIIGNMGRLVVAAEMTLETRNWLRVEASGTLELGSRSTVLSGGDIVFADRGVLLASDTTIRSSGSVQVTQDARWFAQAPQAAPYSSGGSSSCAPQGMPAPVSGAGGGARGGRGGQGSTCNTLVTQARPSSAGPDARNGADGCGCACVAGSPGGLASGGGGGGPLAGGGGGANAGRGGAGGPGRYAATEIDGGWAGQAELTSSVGAPLYGGGAGGSSGSLFVDYPPEACQGSGGHGGGLVRLEAPRFVNLGQLLADGSPGEHRGGFYSLGGGGGGGAGGSWSFSVGSFENRGAISAAGARGGDAVSNAALNRYAGGGGGGGGGRIFIAGLDGGSAAITNLGNLFVGGGLGGVGIAGAGEAGGVGSVTIR